ncbi:hypothetical protein [Sphingobacterium multivorum]|uniref:hypothetical protein n=1 Tax=Sphingobacterium multivorum TaxID=28454 RepID=UPI003DA60C87
MKYFTRILLVFFSITIAYFLGEGDKNLFLILLMSCTPMLYFSRLSSVDSIDLCLLLLVLWLFFAGYVIHKESFRFLSYLYTLCFVFSFLYFKQSIGYKDIRPKLFRKIIRGIIIAYFFVLVVQQLCVLAGLPIFNQISSWDNKFKLAALSPEPSHLARYMFFLICCYVITTEKMIGRPFRYADMGKDKLIWVSYFWAMLSCQSVTAILLCFVIFFRRINVWVLLFGVVGLLLLAEIVEASFLHNSELVDRISAIFDLKSFNIHSINNVDHSMAHRFLPVLTFWDNIDVKSFDFWIGKGMDAGTSYFSNQMYVISGDLQYLESKTSIGGIFSFILDFGIISFGILIFPIYKIFRYQKDLFLPLAWISLNLFSSLNTQFFWFSLVISLYIITLKKKHGNIYHNRYI